MVTFRQDVTGLYNFKKANHISFYYAMIWACTKAINQVDAFHVALRNGELVYLPERKPNFIDLKPAAAHFHIVAMDMEEDICSFCRNTTVRSYEQKSFLEYYPDQQIFIYFTCMPWIDLTALSNERKMNTPDAMDDSIPRICWGKYKKEEDGRVTLGLSIEVNHRFVDGIHIGQFEKNLSEIIDQLQP